MNLRAWNQRAERERLRTDPRVREVVARWLYNHDLSEGDEIPDDHWLLAPEVDRVQYSAEADRLLTAMLEVGG